MNRRGAVQAASFAIVARAANGVIGDGDRIPWRSRADMAHFKAMTMGCALVTGRRTFDSLPGLLPGRHHVVVTSRPIGAPGVVSSSSVEGAVEAALALDVHAIAFAGGLGIYEAALALPWLRTVHLTEIDAAPAGDVVLPPFPAEWRESGRAQLERREGEPLATAVVLVR